MDTNENIAVITSFLNDHQQKVTYVKGDGDSLFSEIRGWLVAPVRDNYVEKRLKIFTSSGILTHWKIMYSMWKPIKLLGHYANWTGPKVEPVSRLNFSSKITTGFYVCGIGLIICVLILFAEVGKHIYVTKSVITRFTGC